MCPQKSRQVCPRCGCEDVFVLEKLDRGVVIMMCDECENTFKRVTKPGGRNRAEEDDYYGGKDRQSWDDFNEEFEMDEQDDYY